VIISSNEPNFGKYTLIAYNLVEDFLEASKEPDYRFHEGKGSAHLTGASALPPHSYHSYPLLCRVRLSYLPWGWQYFGIGSGTR